MADSKTFVLIFLVMSALAAALMWGLLSGEPFTENQWLSQLYFAAGTLGALCFVMVVSMACFVWGPPLGEKENEPRGKLVFDAMKTIVPPIVTLILGYYFGTQKVPAAPPATPAAAGTPAAQAPTPPASSSMSGPTPNVTSSQATPAAKDAPPPPSPTQPGAASKGTAAKP
jgi:hypothetical protein